jgi:peptide/nickel transport system permease protein
MSTSVAATHRLRLPLTGAIGATVLAIWLVVAVLAPWIAPYSAGHLVSPTILGPMTWAFPFGTDYLGRDMLSRVLLGARITVGVAVAATAIACLAGVTLALAAAARGGWLDAVLSRVLDAVISLPSLLFGLVVVASLGASMTVLILTAAVIYTPGAYRTARALAININALDFVAVARARGEGTLFIMREEILPNLLGPVLTDFGLRFVYVVLLLSGLSFLGLGIQPPYADWGSLVRENLEGLVDGSPAVILPALAIATLTIAVNLLIDNLPTRRSPGDGR